jgi:hypothetical protein
MMLKLQNLYKKSGTQDGFFIGGIDLDITRKSYINFLKTVADEVLLNNARNKGLVTPVILL